MMTSSPGCTSVADAHINGFAAAHRDEHLVQRVVVQAHAALQILATSARSSFRPALEV